MHLLPNTEITQIKYMKTNTKTKIKTKNEN